MDVRVKIKTAKDPSNKINLLGICSKNGIRVTRVHEAADGYTLICASIDDIDVLLSDRVQDLLTACALVCIAPPQLKARRSVIVRRVDNHIYEHSVDEIRGEVQDKNSWADVVDVVKFPNSKTIKIQFSNAAIAQRCLSDGLSLFHLHVGSSCMSVDKYIDILTCFRCYALESHIAANCSKSQSYKLCSICAIEGHDWRSCRSTTKKCINCGGDHSALSMQCPRRREILKLKRTSVVTTSSYKEAVTTSPINDARKHITEGQLAAKSLSCIFLALLSSHDDPAKFADSVNSLFLQNNLPTLNLEGFTLGSSALKSMFGDSAPAVATATTSVETTVPNQVSASLDSERKFGRSEEAGMQDDGKPCDYEASVGATQVSTGKPIDYKFFKSRNTTVKSPVDIMRAYEGGNLIITHTDGNVPDYLTAVNVIKSCKVLPNFTDIKQSEFESFRSSPVRHLRSRALKK